MTVSVNQAQLIATAQDVMIVVRSVRLLYACRCRSINQWRSDGGTGVRTAPGGTC